MEQKLQTTKWETAQKIIAGLYVLFLPVMMFPPLERALGPVGRYVQLPLLCMGLGLLLWLAAGRRPRLEKNSLLRKAIVLCVGVTVLSLIVSLALYRPLGPLNGENTLRASLPNDFYALLTIVIFAYNILVLRMLSTRTVDRILTGVMIAMIVSGYLQMLAMRWGGWADQLYNFFNIGGWFLDMHLVRSYGRVCMLTTEPSHAGIAMAILFYPYMLSRLLPGVPGKKWKYVAMMLLALPPIAMTLSSTAYIGIMIDVLVFVVLWFYCAYPKQGKALPWRKIGLAAAGLAVVLVLALKFTPLGYYVGQKIFVKGGSLASTIRYATVLTDLNAFKHYPITGIGNGNQGYFYNETATAYVPENYLSYYEIAEALDGTKGILSGGAFLPAFLSGYGLIGVALLLWFAAACLRAVKRIPAEYDVYKYMYCIGVPSFLALSVVAIAIEGYFLPLFLLSIPFLGAQLPRTAGGTREVLLVDESYCAAGEHNGPYRDAIASIPGTHYYDCHVRFTPMHTNPVKALWERRSYFAGIPAAEVICFLHLDSCYAEPFLFGLVREKCTTLVGTLHWFPRDKKRQLLFKWMAKYFDCIVVHSEYIRSQCLEIGVKNVRVIDYPVFCSVDPAKLTPQAAGGKKVFTCLGGTRRDKGLDILADALQYLDADTCARIKLVAAGKEDEVPYSLLTEKAAAKGIETATCPRVLTDEEYWQCIVDTDVILLPYRRMFTGNSGPMTDGVWLNKYILAPDCGNLGAMIEKYGLGSTFAAEDPRALAEAITRVSRADTTCDHAYRRKLTVSQFVAGYAALFEKE